MGKQNDKQWLIPAGRDGVGKHGGFRRPLILLRDRILAEAQGMIGMSEKQRRLLGAGEFLAHVLRQHDPEVQMQALGSVCYLLVRLALVGDMFGTLAISSNLRMSYRFRNRMVMAPDERDRVFRIFITENRRLPVNRWFVEGASGEVRLAGEIRLRGELGRDKAIMRRQLFRPVSHMDRRIGSLFVPRVKNRKRKDSPCSTAS